MPTLVGTFPAVGGADVRLQVFIGDGQEGTSSAVVGGTEVATGPEIDVSLGEAQTLRGKMLVVSSIVKDRREETDFTSSTVRLSTPGLGREFPQRQLVPEPGSVVNYFFAITFT